MLDPKILKESPNKIKKMLQARSVEFDLSGLIDSDAQRRQLIPKIDDLRTQKNKIAQQISQKKKSGQTDITQDLASLKEITAKLANLEQLQESTKTKYEKLAFSIPNLIDETVPIGKDETANLEIKRWGTPIGTSTTSQNSDYTPKDHINIAEQNNLLDLERAAKVSGARFYYLQSDLVKLNHSLIQYALDYLEQKNYTLIQPPYMINRASMQGAVIAEDFEDVIYKIQDEDLFLIGTSEHAMAAMHSNEILDGKKLPIRYAGISPCFRKEAGAHGRDQKGIFRVHQFEKIEQFVFTNPQDSETEHQRMLDTAQEFYQKLEIPYRVMLLSSGDMGKVSAKTLDIEAWMAAQNSYREVVSCSNCWEYQARRLKIRFRDSTDAQTQFVHTLNSTLVATTRVLVAILENYQTKDGHIRIPKVLQKYMGVDII